MSDLGRLTRSARKHREGAAVTAEFVIVLPIFLAIVLGTLTIASAYFQQLGFTESAREGARFGATLKTDDPNGIPDLAWLEAVAGVTKATAGDWEHVCVTYSGSPARHQRISPVGTYTYRETTDGTVTSNTGGTGTPCFDDGLPAAERRVQVVVAGRANLSAFLFQTTIPMDGASVTPFVNLHTTGSS